MLRRGFFVWVGVTVLLVATAIACGRSPKQSANVTDTPRTGQEALPTARKVIDRTIAAVSGRGVFVDDGHGQQPTGCDSPNDTLTRSYSRKVSGQTSDDLKELLDKVTAFWTAEGLTVDDSELSLDDPAVSASDGRFLFSFHIIPSTGVGRIVGTTPCLRDGDES